MLGAAHALANPLTAAHGIVHGQAVGVMLPHVVRFNASASGARYAELAADLDTDIGLADWLAALLRQAGLADSLFALGITAPDVSALAAAAAAQWTAGFNPRGLTADDLAGLYEAAR
jgi:alcohol dehydrogenase